MCLVTSKPLHNCGYCCKLRNLLKQHYCKVNSLQTLKQSAKTGNNVKSFKRNFGFKLRNVNKCSNKDIIIPKGKIVTHRQYGSKRAKTRFGTYGYQLRNCFVRLIRIDPTKTENYSAQNTQTDARRVVTSPRGASRLKEKITPTKTATLKIPPTGTRTQNDNSKSIDKKVLNVEARRDILKAFSQRIAGRLNLCGNSDTSSQPVVKKSYDYGIRAKVGGKTTAICNSYTEEEARLHLANHRTANVSSQNIVKAEKIENLTTARMLIENVGDATLPSLVDNGTIERVTHVNTCSMCQCYAMCMCAPQRVKIEQGELTDCSTVPDNLNAESDVFNAECVRLVERHNKNIAKRDKRGINGGGTACENDEAVCSDSETNGYVTENYDIAEDDDVTYDDEVENKPVNDESKCVNMNIQKASIDDKSEEEKSFPCLLCLTKSFPTKILLKRHKSKTHKKGGCVQCPHCAFSAVKFIIVEKHVNCCHTGVLGSTPATSTATYECRKCGKQFGNKTKLLKHERNTHSSHLYNCPHCTYQTKRKDVLQIHIKNMHSTDETTKCLYCDFAARLHGQLYKHIRMKHPEKCRDRPPDGLYRCNVCEYVTHTSMSLTFHMTRQHSLEEIILYKENDVKSVKKSYSGQQSLCQCHECDRTFETMADTYRHMKADHSDVRPYACDICDYTCKRRFYLTKHLMKHNKERPFRCIFCSYASKTKDVLSRHMRLKHKHCQESQNTLSFACTVCQSETCIDPKHNVPTSASVTSHDTVASSEHNSSAAPESKSVIPNAAQSQESTRLQGETACDESAAATVNDKMGDSLIEYKCNVCSDVFMTAFERRLHQNMHRERKLVNKRRTLVCNLCEHSFIGHKIFAQHRTKCHKDGDLYKCSQCDFSTKKGRFTLLDHMKEHGRRAAGSVYCCDICEAQFEFESHLKIHISQHLQNGKWFECSICNKKCLSKYALKVHRRNLHGNVKNHSCPHCEATFIFKHVLYRHLLKEHDTKLDCHMCHMCGIQFKFENHLKIHLAKHRRKKFECSLCHRKYSLKSTLKTHMQTVHFYSSSSKLLCPHCGATYKCENSLKYHVKIKHSGLKTGVKCPHCDCVKQSKGSIISHIRRTHPEKCVARPDNGIYECNLCTFAALNCAGLKIHLMQVHGVENSDIFESTNNYELTFRRIYKSRNVKSEARDPLRHPYECLEPDCSVRFNYKSALMMHYKCMHNDVRAFSCDYCTFFCKHSSELKKHIRAKHQDVDPYSCRHCSFTAQFKRDLTAHVKAEHPLVKKPKRRGRKTLKAEAPMFYSCDTSICEGIEKVKTESGSC